MSEGTQSQLAESVEGESEEPLGWPIPWNLSITALDKITKACFRAKADTNPVSAKDVSRVAGIHAGTTATNMKFLASIGVLEARSGKEYVLSAKGTEYAKALGAENFGGAGAVLKELLHGSHLNELIAFGEVQGDGLSYESLFNQIKTLARVSTDDQGHVKDPAKAGIRCLISLLARGGLVSPTLIDQVEFGRSVSSGGRKPIRQQKQTARGEGRPVAGSRDESQGLELNTGTLPFTISIQVEAKDSESIKQLIELIKFLRGSPDDG